ncbi:MAG TPA: hypothetical protein VKK79_22180 [Candidatus Lokiarchaeia archaeon]|nr:hypothetical protein [Candidatus Lokiarchaeia archaeon]
MTEVVLRIVQKQGFDVTTDSGKRHADAITAITGEAVLLEQEKFFFAKQATHYRMLEVGDITLELGGIGINTTYNEDTEWYLWADILEITLEGGELEPYASLIQDIETFFKADKRELFLSGNERDYARFARKIEGEDLSGNLFL